MKKILFLACLIFISTSFGIEYSLRIKALGPDFAYLIPDYETDLYRDPNLYTRDNKFLEIIPWAPFSAKLLTPRFGVMGRYNYDYVNDYHYYPYGQWNLKRSYSVTVKDIWMWDARKLLPSFFGDVWNLTNDLYWYGYKNHDDGYGYDSTSNIKYLLGIPGSSNLGKYFKSYGIVAGGIYLYREWYHHYWSESIDKTMLFVVAKIGVSFRYCRSENDFISAYFETGSPVSIAEIDSLPWSPISDMIPNHTMEMPYFLKPMISRIAFVKGIPISNQSFVAIGFREQFKYQRFDEADTNIILSAVVNTTSLPLAVEYRINTLAIRLGTDVIYDILDRTGRQDDRKLFRWIDHSITWSSTCGVGWIPGPNFAIDLFKKSISLDGGLEVSLKFLF